ncbi:MAG: EF-P beta-lysylation protein EpmB [Pirellulaceae bacterium]|nr:MAG: EF-P beta-lysylation protein EpmB [Pirellulaceae bacterium]
MEKILLTERNSVEATLAAKSRWQHSLRTAVRSGIELCRRLDLPPEAVSPSAEKDFPVFVPEEYLQRIRPGDLTDPLLRQVLPAPDETLPGGQLDPVGDLQVQRTAGMLQKYAGRALVITTGACAIHCRYCFRRHFPYSQVAVGPATWAHWMDQLQADPSIDEVILSGGDPLSLVDGQLQRLLAAIDAVPTVRRIRIHTRFPVVIPSRVTEELIELLRASRAAVYCVLHVNHGQEIDDAVRAAIVGIRRSGAVLLNQSVLLRGVNDDVEVLASLNRELVDMGVLPYYLHQLDPVRGALHFEVGDDRAREIWNELVRQLPGYAVPRLVREVPGEPSKTPL